METKSCSLDEKAGLVGRRMKELQRGEDELWHMTRQSRIGNGSSSTTIYLWRLNQALMIYI